MLVRMSRSFPRRHRCRRYTHYRHRYRPSPPVQSSCPLPPGRCCTPSPDTGFPHAGRLPPLQVSAPLQKRPSSQDAVLAGMCAAPAPSQVSSVHTFPSSVQTVPAVSKQLSVASWQVLHSVSEQGFPACTVQAPPLQVSVPLQ